MRLSGQRPAGPAPARHESTREHLKARQKKKAAAIRAAAEKQILRERCRQQAPSATLFSTR
ncbi:MAG TPA: hypothetical protein ENG91_06450 [Desulfobacteraceae bacterium]|nr:hypothetical protein [Desulfobacteraceae bacterium]